MKITHIATVDTKGGAARATYRLHRGLREQGHDSAMLVRHKHSADEQVQAVAPLPRDSAETLCAAAIQTHYINANRTGLSNILFSFPYPGIDLTAFDQVQSADLIHLHWIVGFQSLVTLRKLLDFGKPVVWTLHDMWPFTGGCHSSGGCGNYALDCRDCPQLEDDPYQLPSLVLRDKQDLLTAPNLSVVAPSQKIAGFARRSLLFQHTPVEVIYNAIDTDVFFPLDKAEAKSRLKLPPDVLTIAFGAEDGRQRSKGMPELQLAIAHCLKNKHFQKLLERKQLQFICFGHPNPGISNLEIPLLELGYISSDERLREIYAAADLFLQPSLEESFGNMAIESLCCGTPVVAFDVGIAPEVLETDVTGRLVPLGDIYQMAEAMLDFATDPEKWRRMQSQCAARITSAFARQTQAQKYIELYEKRLSSATIPAKPERLPSQVLVSRPASPHPLFLPWDTTFGHHVQTILPGLAVDCMAHKLRALRDDIPQAQATQTYSQLQLQFEETKDKLRLSREKLAELRSRLQERRDEVEHLQNDLKQSRTELESIKSGKFWKLRTAWFSLRERLKGKQP